MSSKKQINPFESTKACLTFDDRPSTPPEIRKFRRSAAMEPGKSHHRFDDKITLKLNEKVFGIHSETSASNAAALINLPKSTLVQDIKTGKAEQIYQSNKKEPLGKPYTRHYELPENTLNQSFGIKTVSSLEPAKAIIFPTVTEDVNAGVELYKKSHGSYAPGEQKSRHYTWKNDLNTMTFGMKGTSVAFNGVSKNVEDVLKSKGEHSECVDTVSVEAYRKRQDQLGISRNLSQDSDKRGIQFIYGKGRKGQTFGAIDVIRGKYTEEQQLPDLDLGKSITPGFRNIQQNGRVYGCPSIRNDIPKISLSKRSIADSQNYGDDATAAELINPHAFASLSINESTLNELKSKDIIFTLFKKIGYNNIHNDILNAIFDEVCQNDSNTNIIGATVISFRDALNKYLESLEIGTEEQWLQEHGLL